MTVVQVPTAALTTKVTVALWERLPLVPVMVRVLVPAGVELAVAMVNVDEPRELTEAGTKVAEAPAGSPLAVKATLPLKPLMFPTVTV